jgi:hypothetical protein
VEDHLRKGVLYDALEPRVKEFEHETAKDSSELETKKEEESARRERERLRERERERGSERGREREASPAAY